jgi:hypothetical protein
MEYLKTSTGVMEGCWEQIKHTSRLVLLIEIVLNNSYKRLARDKLLNITMSQEVTPTSG